MSNQEIIRRKQFCQIVCEIRKSNEYLIVGIDVAKDKHHAFMGTATGKSLLRKLIFENNIDGFSRPLKTAEAIRSQNGLSKIVYGIEPTGNYHKPLSRHLIRCDCHVVLVTGQAVKNNRVLIDGR
jgi:transposase